MAMPLDHNDLITFKELLIAKAIQVGALVQLRIGKGFITKEEFFDMWKQGKFTFQRKATIHHK